MDALPSLLAGYWPPHWVLTPGFHAPGRMTKQLAQRTQWCAPLLLTNLSMVKLLKSQPEAAPWQMSWASAWLRRGRLLACCPPPAGGTPYWVGKQVAGAEDMAVPATAVTKFVVSFSPLHNGRQHHPAKLPWTSWLLEAERLQQRPCRINNDNNNKDQHGWHSMSPQRHHK